MTRFAGTGWTQERLDALPDLVRDALSGSQIATELGGGLTRNAVIARCRKLKLVLQGKPIPGPSKEEKPKRNRAQQRDDATLAATIKRRARAKAVPAIPPAPLPPPPIVDGPAPDPLMLPLDQTSDSQCHWPFGDPATIGLDPCDFGYCGHPVREGAPYCPYHCRIAYQPRREAT